MSTQWATSPYRVLAAASIGFEIWGVVDPGQKISISSGNFAKEKIDFSGQIYKKCGFFSCNFTKNFDFLRQNFEEFRLFRPFHNKFQYFSIFSGNFTKEIDFQGKFPNNFEVFQIILQVSSSFNANIGYLQLFLGKLFYFPSKVTTSEHNLLPVHEKI